MLAGSCRWGTIGKYQNKTPMVASKALNIREIWNPLCCHGKNADKLILWSTSSRIVLQEINISDTNWLSYLYSSYLIKILLSIWRHHLANLRILKTWISLEQKERFENSKWHSSSRTGYLFIFWNGLDRKDVNFVIVAL